MNKNMYKFIILILLPVLFYIFISGFKETGENYNSTSNPAISTAKDFTNILLNTSYRNSPCVWDLENHLSQFQELNFNGIHMYDWGSDKFGQFITPLTTTQINNLNELIYRCDTTGLKTVFERTKITRLCYGQRLEYEIVENTGDSITNLGFCYSGRDTNVASYISDSDRTVLHSQSIPTSYPNRAGWLCRDIYENMQHTDLYYFLQSADTADWFLKPMMRIDSGVVDINPTAPVVAIVTYNFKGHKIDSTIIKARNFSKFDILTNSYLYGGNYKNSFDFSLEGSGTDLSIPGSLDSNGTLEGLNYGYGGNSGVNGFERYNVKQCKVDFRVYWFGEVDVWFDKMTVDDRLANILFNQNPGLNYDSLIYDEVSNFGGELDLFFADELVYSQFSCFKYVQDYIRNYNQANGKHAKLSYAISNNLNHYTIRNTDNVFDYNLSVTNPDVIQIDAHAFPIYDYQGAVPINALQNYDSRIPNSWRATNVNYNIYLQKVLGQRGYYSSFPREGSFIYQITTTKDQVEQMQNPAVFIVQPQIQHWMEGGAVEFLGGNREPLNEEIEVQAGIAIAHGAESLSWFIFESDSITNSYNGACSSPPVFNVGHSLYDIYNAQEYFIWFGLLNKFPDTTRRTKNIYGQNKWEYVKRLNQKILNWKPTLDMVSWLGGYSVHSENAGHEFISEIKSIYRIPSAPFTFSPSNEDAVKYWEMGFFEPDFSNSSVDQYDKSKYFIMVNRRCVPESYEGIGDIRALKIKFDTTDLNQFNNWRITDVNTGDTMTFNVKNQGSGGFLDLGGNLNSLGYFDPGEGKLFKLAPVMQEGGTLVADELVQGITFVCNAPVYNNGKNISILEGTKIEFKSGAGLNLNSGSLLCSNSSTNSGENVLLKGYNGQTWNGIVMENTYKSKIQRTRFEDAKKPLIIESTSEGTLFSGKIIRRNYFKVTGDSGIAVTIRNQHNVSIDSNTYSFPLFAFQL